MRHTATATSLSWIPSDSMSGLTRASVDLGLAHVDPAPPTRLGGPSDVQALQREDRIRFANVVGLWAEVDDGRIVDAGVAPGSGLVMGATTLRVGALGITYPAVSLPVLRSGPEGGPDSATLVQTVGGRTGWPLPRPVPHPPFVRWTAPIVWTTVALTLRADGTSEARLEGASAYPRHWLYDTEGDRIAKSGVTDERGWLDHAFGPRTPWGASDAPALVTAIESELEHRLSRVLMAGRPAIRRDAEGAELVRQGDVGTDLLLLLDGVVRVEVDGAPVAEVGPGALLGERAALGDGRRTATLVAATPVRIATAPFAALDRDALATLAAAHRREEGG